MTQQEIDHIRKKEMWREIIKEVHESGRPVSEVCNEHGVKPTSFYYWNGVIMKETLDSAKMLGVMRAPVTDRTALPVVEAARKVTCGAAEAKESGIRALREKVVEMIFEMEHDGSVHFTRKTLQRDFTPSEITEITRWLETKHILGCPGSGKKGANRRVKITRAQWEQIKDELLDTDGKADDILRRIGQEGTAIATVTSASSTVSQAKEIDTQMPLSVDGVVFDMEHNRLYVPGSATEKTISVAISILKGLLGQPSGTSLALA